MTHHPIVVLPDGTRRYSNYTRYTPIPLEKRKYKIRKPDVPGVVRVRGDWYYPLELKPDDERVLPETVPDEIAYEHMSVSLLCRCHVCIRPAAKRWQRKWRKEHGLQFYVIKPVRPPQPRN